jgi:hypothetical protein
MRRLLAIALASLAAACSTPPCQELGERLCSCTGVSGDTCKTQVEDQLKGAGLSDSTCEQYLSTCDSSQAPTGNLCEWLNTAEGKRACGIARAP